MKALKVIGIVVGGLVVIAAAGLGAIYAKSSGVIGATYDVPEVALSLPTDSSSLARGRHLVEAVAKCIDCHGADLGGTVFVDGMPFARIIAPNLTRGRGGVTAAYTDAQLLRAIRHGVRRDGRGLAIMPAPSYIYLSDADLTAIAAYVRGVPAVDRELPASQYGPISRMLLAMGKLPVFGAALVDHQRTERFDVPEDTTAAYGRYLTAIGGCRECHNSSFSGGPIPGADPESPPAADITPTGIGSWSYEQFREFFRTGLTPGGRTVEDRFMPWRNSGRMSETEFRAVWNFLRSLPPRAFGET
ncbi:MAG TPA: cytochrome c [Gemmatimonadales bacterium]|nr:cytochrome c [Gemmatimonadales bacterium]